MEESVVNEIIAENLELRKKLEEIMSKPEYSSKIYVLSEAPLKITGVLISEGVWKGVYYKYDELVKALDKFKGLKGMVMHGKTEEFGDRKIGELTKVAKDDLLRAITFEAIITDEEAAKKIKEGVFDAVSIKGMFEKLDTSQTPPVGINYTPIEWSLTGSPACDNCLIFQVQELCKSLEMESLIKENKPIQTIGGSPMSEQNKDIEYIEIKENQLLLLPENYEQLEDNSIFECEIVDIDKFLELAKTKEKAAAIKVPAGKYPKATATKVVKIYGYYYPYYGYPYYYYYGYPYYYYYGYPYYYYYGQSFDELLDILIENESYREFMKKCMKEKGGGPEALKACAVEWKKTQKAEEEEEEKELAKAKCPVCGKEFDTVKAFKEHWKEEHEEKYGAYGQVKKLVKRMLEDKEFRNNLKKAIIELEASEEKKEEAKPEAKGEENKPQEQKTEAKPQEVKPEEKQEKVPEPVEVSEEDILSKIPKTPTVAAELFLKSIKEEE
ncbi:MAG: hypothetical protein QXK24_00260 [Ignisphaera sp.]